MRTFDLARLVAADRTHLALLDHAQQLHLEIQRQLGDLVEEQRSSMRLQDEAFRRVQSHR